MTLALPEKPLAPTVGMLVDYASNDGSIVTPAVISMVDESGLVQLAVPDHVHESGLLHNIPGLPQLTCGHWSPQVQPTKAEKKKYEYVANPFHIDVLSSGWYFSASQIEMWETCNRKWGYKYIDKAEGKNRFAARGDEVHGFVEGWLKYGIVPPEHVRTGKLTRAAITRKLLPEPTTARVETAGQYISQAGFRWTVKIDCTFEELYPDFGKTLPVVLDHKSTTDFKWALIGDKRVEKMLKKQQEIDETRLLRNNAQGLIYASYGFTYWNSLEMMLRWVYYKDDKKRPTSRAEECRLSKSEAHDKFGPLDARAQEIRLYGLTAKKAEDLPANTSGCEARGGCPYLERCPVTDAERLEAYMTQSSLRSRLMPNGGAPANGAAAPKTTVVAAPAAAPAAAGGMSALERLRQQNAGGAPPAPPQMAPAAPAAAAPAAAGGMSALERLRQQNAGGAPPAAAPAAAAPAQRAPAPNPNPPAQPPMTAMQRLQAQQSASKAAQPPAAQSQLEAQQESELPPGQELPQDFAPDQVNPPEMPDNVINDADELAAANAANVPANAGKKTRGRPAGSVTIKPVSDEGHIFEGVFTKTLEILAAQGVMLADVEQLETVLMTAGVIAREAIKEFRKPLEE